MKEMLQIQERVDHLLQETHSFMAVTVLASMRGGPFSLYETVVPMYHHTLIHSFSTLGTN